MSVTLHPSSALGFNRPLTQHVKRTLSITNNNTQPVAFKVKTTAPKLYCVRPNSGRVEPGETVEVQVMLQAMKEEPPLSTKCKDKFLIQSTLITQEKELLGLHEIWNSVDSETHVNSQKIRVVYLPPEGQTVVEEDEGPANRHFAVDGGPDDAHLKHFDTVRQFPPGNGHPVEPIPEFEESRNVVPPEPEAPVHYEESQEDLAESAQVVNVAVHPPPRDPTPPPPRVPSRSNNDELDIKLVEATEEISRLRLLLAAMPEPSKIPSSVEAPIELRRRHRSLSSGTTTIGTETEVSSYVDEPLQPEGVPLQVVIIIALGVFITTYLFF